MGKANRTKKSLLEFVGYYNKLIDRRKSTIFSFRKTSKKFRAAIDSLEKGIRAKRGGNALPKKIFVNNIRFGVTGGHIPEYIRKEAAKNIASDLSVGVKGIKEAKKLRKKTGQIYQQLSGRKATKRINRTINENYTGSSKNAKVRFIKIRGRVVPIRVKGTKTNKA